MRVKNAVNSKKKKRRILKFAKGFRGSLSRQYTLARQSYYRALKFSFDGRRNKKGDFRKVWITRINIAARNEGLKYNELIHGLKLANVSVNRKMLAELAVNDANSFKEFVNIAKTALGK
ncbi:MAG TPA: 50S ribosomal protein L20 [Fervidobacterium sp.]|nr:50S ribosomal protein L20 [Fervidobacterium sp.]HOH53989.1 50S ribosomal protein L20 [Fervidobacterium sp.]